MEIYLIVLFICIRIVSGEEDACTTARPLEQVSKRGTGCLGTTLSNVICDRQLQDGWYFAEHNGERLAMPTSCPPMFSCGTGSGLWLNGIHPSTTNQTLEINVCLRGLPTDNDECCAETFPIKVKNCGQFYAYYLTYPSTCDQAYCFGDQSCPVSTTSRPTTTTSEPDQCSTAKPMEKASFRGTQCLGTDLSSMVCDRQITPGWYYAEHEGRKLSMPSTCPDMLTCGTGAPIWMRDTHPSSRYTTIDATACMRGLPTDDNPCCAKTIPVKITNCGDFFAYDLSYTDTCDEAYCFGDQSCPVTTTAPQPTTPKQQTTLGSVAPKQCLSAKPMNKTPFRGTQCSGTDLSSMLCDRQIPSGWYYAEHKGSKLSMPSTCPDILKCGTSGPIWMKDSHPTTPYTTIDAVACRRGLPTDDDPCCAKTYPVKITNCGDFYVYYLPYTDTCDEAYCFGEHKCEKKPGHDGNEPKDDDSEFDEPWDHKSGHKGTGRAVILTFLIIILIGGVTLVICVVKRCRKGNTSSVNMENQQEKQIPIDFNEKSIGLPPPFVYSGGENFYSQLTAPHDTKWNMKKSDLKY